ncbi:MAG: LysR family transcriptional regulator [Clostridiales bacterium]|nr:LysR family transcriptional regulator [Clostridiales bacterium]
MYNRQLETFIKAAELGSFSKAANALFITPSSLIQQINLLEAHLGIRLFHRSARGVTLTPAGTSVYEDAKNIIHLSQIAIERAKAIEKKDGNTIRVGTSLFTKCRYLTDIWSRVVDQYPDIKVELVAQKSIVTMTSEPMADMGVDYDLQEGIYLEGLFNEKCNFFELFPARISISIPQGNHLFSKEKISIKDLYDEKIMMTKRGHSPGFDSIRDILSQKGSAIEIIDTEYYDINKFATCELNNYLMVTLDVWSDIYPSMRTYPLDTDCFVPYGLLYSLDPTDEVIHIIETAKGMVEEGNFFKNK